jgi:glycosyltransferase involved in cell wall biosynthesis
MKTRPRLALCTEYSITAHGGTEVLVRELVRTLSRDWEVILVSNDDSAEFLASADGASIREHFRWNPGELRPESVLELAAFLQEQRVDLAHFHFGGNYGWNNRRWNGCPLIHVSRQGIPCLTTNHGVFALLDGYCAHYRPLWMKLALLPGAWLAKMQTLAHTRKEIAVSRHDLANLLAWYRPVAGKFGQIYHSRIDETEADPSAPARLPVILCVGTIGHRKGQALLARAFARVAAQFPEWKLILAGRKADSGIVAEVEAVRTDPALADRITMIEGLSDQEVTGLMQTASIFAMPSVQEGLGLSLQEALWHGCPAVGSRVGGIPELIDHQSNGLLVAPGSETELAAAMENVMGDAALRARLAGQGRASVLAKGMTSQAMAARYQALYEEILRQG